MKTIKFESTKIRQLILTTALAVTVATVACAKQSENKVEAAQPAKAAIKQASLQTTTPVAPALKSVDKTSAKQSPNKLLRYKSRDYGVSFEYPWQYQFVSAKAVSIDESLQPKSDGFDGQITLARIDLPKGFYPDTDFDSGYFTLGLNPDVEEKDCKASLMNSSGKSQVAKINDVEFLWNESEVGGKGTASKIRNYVAFNNGVCYEIELGLKTRNQDGTAREVNADQVMRKLEGMLNTVKFSESQAKPAGELQSAIDPAKPEGQK